MGLYGACWYGGDGAGRSLGMNNFTITKDTPKVITEKLDECLTNIREITRLIPLATHLSDVISEFKEDGVGSYATCGGLYFVAYPTASSDVANVLRKLVQRGCRIIGRPKDLSTSPWDFALNHPDFPVDDAPERGTIFITCYFSRSGDNSCKMVQVGTKMIEQPIFKVVCSETEAYHGE